MQDQRTKRSLEVPKNNNLNRFGARELNKEGERMKNDELSREKGQERVFGDFVGLEWLEDNGSGLDQKGDG